MESDTVTNELKEMLENYRFLLVWADDLKRQILNKREEKRLMLDAIGSANGSTSEVRGGGQPGDRTGRTVEKIFFLDQQIAELEAERKEYMDRRKQVRTMVSQLNRQHREVIALYYFGPKTSWKDVAKKIYENERHVRRKHDVALVSLKKMSANVR